MTPLYIASQEGHHDVVQSLLGAGAEVNIATSRVRTRFGIYENVLKMTVPISRPGKGIEIEQKYEKVWKITLAYKLCTSAVNSWA